MSEPPAYQTPSAYQTPPPRRSSRQTASKAFQIKNYSRSTPYAAVSKPPPRRRSKKTASLTPPPHPLAGIDPVIHANNRKVILQSPPLLSLRPFKPARIHPKSLQKAITSLSKRIEEVNKGSKDQLHSRTSNKDEYLELRTTVEAYRSSLCDIPNLAPLTFPQVTWPGSRNPQRVPVLFHAAYTWLEMVRHQIPHLDGDEALLAQLRDQIQPELLLLHIPGLARDEFKKWGELRHESEQLWSEITNTHWAPISKEEEQVTAATN